MAAWKLVDIVVEGQPIDIGGIDPWGHSWRQMKIAPVELPHPSYPHQRHQFYVYEVEANGRKIVFAAGEVSANVWVFYIPK